VPVPATRLPFNIEGADTFPDRFKQIPLCPWYLRVYRVFLGIFEDTCNTYVFCISFHPLRSIRIYYTAESTDFFSYRPSNFTSKGGDNTIIDFDEQKFKNEIKSIVKKYGGSSSDAKMVIAAALSAVYKASKPVNQ
jgi:hypothetical protein